MFFHGFLGESITMYFQFIFANFILRMSHTDRSCFILQSKRKKPIIMFSILKIEPYLNWILLSLPEEIIESSYSL